MKTWIGLLVAALIATLGTSGTAWAQDTKDASTQPAAEQPAEAADDDSGKLIYVGITPIGIHIPTWATHPVQAGVYLGDFLIGGEYGQFSFKIDDGGDTADGTYRNMGVFARWFAGRSFNFLFALNKRTWDTDAIVTTEGGITARANLTADATVYTVGIGNHWVADFGLVFAMDYLVLSSLASSTSTFTGLDPTIPAGERAAVEKDMESLGDLLNTVSAWPGIFILSVGWAF